MVRRYIGVLHYPACRGSVDWTCLEGVAEDSEVMMSPRRRSSDVVSIL